MRIKTIIVGGIAALALALTANVGITATPRVSGSLVSLVAATTTVTETADRDLVAVATRSTDRGRTAEPPEKPVVALKPVATRALQLTAACQQAIDRLETMLRADVAEDAAERAAQQPPSAASIAADRAEDLAEVQRWKQALMAARTACQPQPTSACLAALISLQALLPSDRPEEWSALIQLPSQIDLTGLRAAFTAVAVACGHLD